MQELDKPAMGKRIKQIRLEAQLRQWELAKLLGTTQSAVHKYEHGVVPEPKRLVELARLGKTSVEWVLTGTHWESGSAEQQRLSPDLLNTAMALRRVEDRKTLDEALRIVEAARDALADGDNPGTGEASSGRSVLADHASETFRLLEAARRIQTRVLSQVNRETIERLTSSPLLDESQDAPETPTTRR